MLPSTSSVAKSRKKYGLFPVRLLADADGEALDPAAANRGEFADFTGQLSGITGPAAGGQSCTGS